MDTYLDRLELHGFKSFPDKTVLKLHRGITAVVGPNGCGKSNIVDSILWVLGEQKVKNLRGENNEDLIFNGSASKKPLGMTEVGAMFNAQNEEIYIARRFFRSGEGKYILNERFCRNKDIQDVLFKLHMGGLNYFIFEQGSIEKLVSLKPSEKRMLIEEAAGISQYLIRKKETASKLLIAQQNLDNIQILIADKEGRLKDLKNQVSFVQRYRKTKNDKVDNLRTLLKRKHDAFQQEFESNKGEIETLMERESVAVREITSLEKDVLRLEEKRWMIDKDLKQNQQNIFDFNKKILSFKGDIERSKQSRGFKSQKVADLKRTIETNKQEIAHLNKQEETASNSLSELEAKLKSEKTGHEDINSQLADLNDRLENTHAQNSGLKSELFNIQSELARTSNKIKEIDKRMMRIENEVASKKNFAAQLNEQSSATEIDEKEAGIQTLSAQQTEEETHFKEIETQYNQNKRTVDELAAESRNLTNEVKNLENQKTKYLEIKKKIVGETPNAANIKHLGCLQDLIQADKKYHKILENFYYDEMDAVLLENNDNGDQFFDIKLNKCLLRRETEERRSGIEAEPGFIGWIRDLYHLPDPALKPLFKNGVLVDTLKNGMHLFITYGIDVVTQTAETITRFGLLVRSREKGILDVIEEIREIENKREKVLTKLAEIKTSLDKEKEKQPFLAKELDECRLRVRSIDKALLQLKTSLETLKKNRDTNLKRIQFTESEISLLNVEKEKLQDEFEALDLRNSELESSNKELNQRRDRYQEDVQRIKEEINRIEKDFLHKENAINLIKEKINSIHSALKGYKISRSKLEQAIQANEQEIVTLNQDIEESKTREETLANELTQQTRQKDDLENVVRGQEKEFNALNTEIKEKSATLSNSRKILETIKENKKEIEINLSAIKKDLFQLEDYSFKELNTELKNLEAVPELMDRPLKELEALVQELDERLIKMRDSNRLNFSAESEYELLAKDYFFLLTQKEDIIKSIEDMNQAIGKIDDESRVSFMEAFAHIKENFRKNFEILFEGGESEMVLLDENDVLETGLDIKAQPPGKRLLSLKLLSGGEKTLTSLAFLFALFQYKPSPFCVFDEVDASLDEANIQRFLKFLHRLKQNTQFLIITHNFKTMEEADYIYGITMNEPGISTIYSMKMSGKNELKKSAE
ncbi:MAG: chromosome segregation protein SMC [Candidatus Omnitrophota bacterium]